MISLLYRDYISWLATLDKKKFSHRITPSRIGLLIHSVVKYEGGKSKFKKNYQFGTRVGNINKM